jgi:hypothetical protein
MNNDLKGVADENYDMVTGPAHPHFLYKRLFGRLYHGTERYGMNEKKVPGLSAMLYSRELL